MRGLDPRIHTDGPFLKLEHEIVDRQRCVDGSMAPRRVGCAVVAAMAASAVDKAVKNPGK
jgi:hypothetical protein